MAFRLVEVLYCGPEGETHQCDWLSLGLYSELGSPCWEGRGFPGARGMPCVPQHRQPGHSSVWQRIRSYISAFVAAKITLEIKSLSKLRS